MAANHWTFDVDATGIAWLKFDRQHRSANTLDPETLGNLDETISAVTHEHPSGLVIVSAKSSGFIAGADVKRFAGIDDTATATAFIKQAQDVLARLENLAFPTVAAIHGYCLGGGLELALACRHRVCTSDPNTRLGLPEVRLGIFPAFGGTVRSIRTMGDLAALDLMLTGRALNGRRALRAGLVDAVVPRRQLEAAARALVSTPNRPRRPKRTQRVAGLPPIRPLVAWQLRRKLDGQAPKTHYPAPWALVDHWRQFARRPAEMYRSEADRVAELIIGESAQNLVRTFLLQDTLKRQGDPSAIPPESVHVVGGGIMGGDIAAWCALQGLRVSIQDRTPEILVQAMNRARALFARKLRNPRLERDAMDRLSADHRGDAMPHAQLVIEAIFEDIDAKQGLFREIERRARNDAILASNTSSIPLETIGEALVDPSRLVGLHFFNPVAKMPLLEIVRSQHTDTVLIDRALAFGRRIKKMPLVVRSSPGFLVNRILMPYLLEAFELLSDGIPPELVDQAAIDFGMPVGPVELADSVGLDICLSVADMLIESAPPPEGLREIVSAGRLGKKSGHGFYRWEKGKALKNKTKGVDAHNKDYGDRLILSMLNEAVACLHEQIVVKEDLLDAGVVFGTGFAPFRGGPLHYIRTTGADRLLERLRNLEARYGPRFASSEGWRELVDDDTT